MSIFNATLFNKAIFNTRFIASGGMHKGRNRGRIGKLRKRKMYAQALLHVSSSTSIHSSITFESKITGEIHSRVESKLSIGNIVNVSSKLLHELYKPIGSAIYKDVDISVKGNVNIMELNSNKMLKYNTIQNILSLLDES